MDAYSTGQLPFELIGRASFPSFGTWAWLWFTYLIHGCIPTCLQPLKGRITSRLRLNCQISLLLQFYQPVQKSSPPSSSLRIYAHHHLSIQYHRLKERLSPVLLYNLPPHAQLRRLSQIFIQYLIFIRLDRAKTGLLCYPHIGMPPSITCFDDTRHFSIAPTEKKNPKISGVSISFDFSCFIHQCD